MSVTFLLKIGDGPTPENVIDVTALFLALQAEQNAWREGRGVYSVPLMQAHGAVIAQSEKLPIFADDGDDEAEWDDRQD